MFSPDIIDSDAFLDMGHGSQVLYFHLAMRADDDGFVNPKKVMRVIGSSEDDLKVLLAKRFLLAFKSGVVVVKHWLIHNLIRHDRYKETMYLEEKRSLAVKENKAYTELATTGQPNGNQMATQVRLGKVRLGKETPTTASAAEVPQKDPEAEKEIGEVIKAFEPLNTASVEFYKRKPQREAARRLIASHGAREVIAAVREIDERKGEQYTPLVDSPIDLERKWAKIQRFRNKATNRETILWAS